MNNSNEGNIIGIERGLRSTIITIEIWHPINPDVKYGHCKITQEENILDL